MLWEGGVGGSRWSNRLCLLRATKTQAGEGRKGEEGAGVVDGRLWGLPSHICVHLFKRWEKQDSGGRGYLKPKVWGAEAVSGWEEEEEEEWDEEEGGARESAADHGGARPPTGDFFYFLPFALRCIYLCLNIMLPLTCETVWESHLSNSLLTEYLYSFCIVA